MSIPLKKFLEDFRNEPVESNRGDCALCPGPIIDQLREDDQYIVVDGKKLLVHADCYFGMMGKELEEHPILILKAIRGT